MLIHLYERKVTPTSRWRRESWVKYLDCCPPELISAKYTREDHVRMSTPFSVMRIVCSNWADLEPSRDTAVQPSLRMSIGGRPSVIIGSETRI